MTDTSSISEARRQLLEKFRRGELQAPKSALERLVPRPRGAGGRLSPDLEQLWVHDRVCAGAPINNESFTIHKRGPMDPLILQRCFNEIIRRHEIWQSAFPGVEGKVVQRVDATVQVKLPLTDLSGLSPNERAEESARIATEDARRPFDLNEAPLFRLRLVRWAEDYHRIYLTAHRLIFDCPSIERVLLRELASLYSAFAAGQPSALLELDFQYADYAAWKERHLADGGQSAQLEYWRQKLSEDLPRLELPNDRPRPAEPTWASAMETCAIPVRLSQAMQQLGTSEGVTSYMILLATFQVLLYRFSGQNDIVVGGKTNTRTRPEFEPLLGSFVNTIVFRNRIGADLSFREFLGRVKGGVLGALAHSDVPFDQVLREVASPRDLTRHPLFQVLFSTRAPFAESTGGWELTDMEVHSGASGFDLFIEFAEHSDPHGGKPAWTGRFVYSTDLFDRATILRMLAYFQTLLERLVSDPDQTISEVPLLTETERDASGKQSRRASPESRLLPKAQREIVPPQDDIEERLTNLWQEMLGVYPVSVTDNYFDLGGHSFLAVRLFSEIKFCFHVDLPLGTLFYAPTVRTLAAAIRAAGVHPAAAVIPIQPNGSKPPIYCIGALNGELILFRPLALELGQDQPLFGLQPFSLVDRLSTVEELAAAYIEQLQLCGEPRPFCLLGYSFGGLVAVEMARQLRKSGAKPPLVVMIDSNNVAGSKALEPWRDRIRRYRYHVDWIINRAGGLAHLRQGLQRRLFRVMHKVSTSVGAGTSSMASDIAGRQLLAAENWQAKSYPGRVWLFKAESGSGFFASDPGLGWSKHLSDLRLEAVPGDHGTINTGANLKILAQKLTAALDEWHRAQNVSQTAATSRVTTESARALPN